MECPPNLFAGARFVKTNICSEYLLRRLISFEAGHPSGKHLEAGVAKIKAESN